MGVRIFLKPGAVWDFYEKNEGRCSEELILIADADYPENKQKPFPKCEIYLTEERGLPTIVVYKGGDRFKAEGCLSKRDAEDTVKRLYLDNLYPDIKSGQKKESQPLPESLEKDGDAMKRIDEEYQREDELVMAFSDFLSTVYKNYYNENEGFGDGKEELFIALDDVLDLLSSQFDWPIYRPMTLLLDDEQKVDTDYPYQSAETLEKWGIIDEGQNELSK